jgi:hypothetical protein
MSNRGYDNPKYQAIFFSYMMMRAKISRAPAYLIKNEDGFKDGPGNYLILQHRILEYYACPFLSRS